MASSMHRWVTSASAAMLLIAFGGSALADTWAQQHPRRAEVNHRLNNQNRRIHQQVKQGDLTKTQAHTLHKDDRSIRSEERDMARRNGGHITKSEQHVLNQQQNGVSQQIGH